MSFFNKKVVLLEEKNLSLGELNYSVPGGYDNIKTFPLNVKVGKKVKATIKSTNPVDVSFVDATGMNIKFKEGITDIEMGPIEVQHKGIMTIIFGIYRGEKSTIDVTVWME